MGWAPSVDATCCRTLIVTLSPRRRAPRLAGVRAIRLVVVVELRRL